MGATSILWCPILQHIQNAQKGDLESVIVHGSGHAIFGHVHILFKVMQQTVMMCKVVCTASIGEKWCACLMLTLPLLLGREEWDNWTRQKKRLKNEKKVGVSTLFGCL